MATPISSTQLLGARLLKEISSEEGSLEAVRSFLELSLSSVHKACLLSIRT